MWEVMFWPILACILLPWLLVYLGLHVVQRGIIFIDIAMAQMASLGICLAVLLHIDLESWTTFGIALHWSCFIVAAVLVVAGIAAYAKGAGDAGKELTPSRTIRQVKQDIATAKEQLT